MTKRITVTIASDGSITAEVGGQQGPRCLDDTGTVAALCDFAVITESRLTSEYSRAALNTTEQDRNHFDRDNS